MHYINKGMISEPLAYMSWQRIIALHNRFSLFLDMRGDKNGSR
jgi:hypothetical protein